MDIKDLCQTERYAQFRKRLGWEYEWRRGNLFLLKHKLGLTLEACYFPSEEIFAADIKGAYCQVRGSMWRLPNPFVCDQAQIVRVALNRNIEEIWTSLTKHTRNAVRQARNRGTWFSEGDSDSFGVFWKIYESTAARHGFKMMKYQVLREYLRTGFCKIFFVGINEKSIGAYVVLEGDQIARYFCGGFLYDYQHFRPNNLAHWNILEYYHEKGFSFYDLGGCGARTPEYAIYSFKTGFGKPVTRWNCIRGNWFLRKMVSLYRNLVDSERPHGRD